MRSDAQLPSLLRRSAKTCCCNAACMTPHTVPGPRIRFLKLWLGLGRFLHLEKTGRIGLDLAPFAPARDLLHAHDIALRRTVWPQHFANDSAHRPIVMLRQRPRRLRRNPRDLANQE